MGWDFRGIYTVADEAAREWLAGDEVVRGTWALIRSADAPYVRLPEAGLLVVHGFDPADQIERSDGCPWDAFWPDGDFDGAELRTLVEPLAARQRPPVNLVAWMRELADDTGQPVALYQCDMHGGDIGDESVLLCAADGNSVTLRRDGFQRWQDGASSTTYTDPLQTMLRAFGGQPWQWAFEPHERPFDNWLRTPGDVLDRLSIFRACRNGDAPTVATLLEWGADLSVRQHPSLLALAAAAGSPAVVSLLLGAGLSALEPWSDPLGSAADPACARLLIAAGARLDGALAGVAQRGFADTARYLIATGAPVDFTADEHALWFAAAEGGIDWLVESALATGIPLDQRRYGDSALELAALGGHTTVVDRLLTAGATLTPATVVRAAEGGHAPLLRSLLTRGADPDSTHHDRPALYAAAYHGHRDAMTVLLAAGADPTGHENNRPLQAALTAGRADLVRLLLDPHPDLIHLPELGSPPLFTAVGAGDQPLVDLLLSYGADPDEPNRWGSNLRDFAHMRNITLNNPPPP